MNDEKKDQNAVASGDQNANASALEADDSAWDDDDSGATLATDGPSFEIPSNVPSPITVPPAAVIDTPRVPFKATLVGIMSEDARGGFPKPPSTRVIPAVGTPPSERGLAPAPPPSERGLAPAPPPSERRFAPVAPPPMVLAAADLDALSPPEEEESPTMAGAPSPPSNRPLRDDAIPAVGFVPRAPPTIDNDVETMAIGADSSWLQLPDNVEDTRPVSRDEFSRHQDAHVVVADDAVGEDATLAIGPGQVDPRIGLGLGTPDLGPPLARPQQMPPETPPYGVTPRWPAPDPAPPVAQVPYAMPGPAMAAPPSWQQGGGPMMGQPPPPGAFGPPGQAHQGAPPSSQMGWGHAPTAQGPHAPQGMMQAGGPPAPWMPPPSAPAEGGIRFTPQLMVLLGVGVICVAIFVTGIVLFVTTKF